MKNNYSYNCIDKSIILPYFKNFYVSQYFRFVPYGLTANFITLISSGMIFYLLFASYGSQERQTSTFAAIIAFCLHGYIVGDHLDGMQAKETGTSSPLGEFLDHYLDVYNGAIIFLACVIFFGDIPSSFFYLFLWFNFLAFGATMMEELEMGELIFGPLGTLEGVLITILFFLSWIIPEIKEFWLTELAFGFPKFWIIIGLAGLGYVGTFIDILWRMRYSPTQFNIFIFLTGLLSFLLYSTNTPILVGWWALTLYSGEYIARVMGAYLCGKKHEYPDLFGSLFIGALGAAFYGGVINGENFQFALLGMTTYLGLKVIRAFWRVFSDLKVHWNWINPIDQTEN